LLQKAHREEEKTVIAAVDIGGTKIAVGMVDDSGKVLSRQQNPSNAPGGYRSALSRTIDMLRATSASAGTTITGIGIGSTGVVYPDTGAFGDVDLLPGWQGHNLVTDLAGEFAVSAAIENDGDASALGEAAWGAGKDKSSLIYVTVGTGIGGGIILDKKLYRGAGTSHPEVGHHVVDASGPPCTCGYKGCWEALATGPAMAAWFNQQALQDSCGEPLTAAQVCEKARAGEPLALRAIERESLYLGLGVANLINLFVPEMIVFGGSVMKSADLFLDRIRRVVRQGCRFVPAKNTALALASLGEDANLIGAARVWYHRFGPTGK
jgi:glucokinase